MVMMSRNLLVSTVSLTAMMAMITFVVLLIILFFKTPYKRLEAESASNPNISSSSSSHSLTATSGYGSEVASRHTNSSNSTRTHSTVPPRGERESPEAESDIEQCRL